jgi:hypothetical protein
MYRSGLQGNRDDGMQDGTAPSVIIIMEGGFSPRAGQLQDPRPLWGDIRNKTPQTWVGI